MRPLEGMSVIVTGGGSGIGAGTARHFAARGAQVVISGRRQTKVDAVADEIGAGCRAIQADVTVAADRQRLLDAALEHGGGLDVLVNNAGNMYATPAPDYDEAKLRDVFDTNVIGPMLLTGAAVPHLEARRGAVIFVGSVHTVRAYPGASPYAATKGAIQTLTRVLAAELGARQIRVNCVQPGAVFTEINQRAGLFDDEAAYKRLVGMSSAHALGRIGTVEEIAEAIEHLAAAEWTTGAILPVDGGLGLGVTALGLKE